MPVTVPTTSGADFFAATPWTSGTTTGSMTKPTALADGDIKIAHLYDQVAASTWPTRPTGWAEAYHATATSTRGDSLQWKAVTTASSEPAGDTFGSSASGRGCAQLYRASGCRASNPFDSLPASDVYFSAAAATMSVPGVTVVDPNALSVIHCFANGTGSVTHTFSAPGHFVLTSSTVNNAGSTSSTAILVGTAAIGATGATGNITVTMTPSDSVTNPASGGGYRYALAPGTVPTSGLATITLSATATATAPNTASGGATITLAATASGKAVASAAATITLSGKVETPAMSWVRQRAGGNQIAAHRDGCWATYGEETRQGYNIVSAWLSYAVLEISFWVTSDGVYVASHDQTTGRVFSGTDLDIPTNTWASLSAKTTLVGGYPIATVDQIIADHPGRIFVLENKQNTNNATRAAYVNALCSGRWISKCFGPSGIGWCNAGDAYAAPAMAYFFPTDLGNIANAFTGWTGSSTLIYELADYSSSGTALPTQANATTFYTYTLAHGLLEWVSVIDTSTQKTTATTHATTAGATIDGFMMSNVLALVPSDVAAGGATITLSGAATGLLPAAAGSATITLAGTASAAGRASAAATITLAGTASAVGVASGAATITLAATGNASAPGVAAGSATITLAATVTGAKAAAAAAATIILAGAAAASVASSGSATITLVGFFGPTTGRHVLRGAFATSAGGPVGVENNDINGWAYAAADGTGVFTLSLELGTYNVVFPEGSEVEVVMPAGLPPNGLYWDVSTLVVVGKLPA